MDRVKPEWPMLMKLETFTALHANPDRACVADRVFGHWSLAPSIFVVGGYVKYGMNIIIGSPEEMKSDDAALVAAWRKETLKRLEAGNA